MFDSFEDVDFQSINQEDFEEWLKSSTFDQRSKALCWVVTRNSILVHLLLQTSLDINYQDSYAFRKACRLCSDDMFALLNYGGINIRANDDEAIKSLASCPKSFNSFLFLARQGNYTNEELSEIITRGLIKDPLIFDYLSQEIPFTKLKSSFILALHQNNVMAVQRLVDKFEPEEKETLIRYYCSLQQTQFGIGVIFLLAQRDFLPAITAESRFEEIYVRLFC